MMIFKTVKKKKLPHAEGFLAFSAAQMPLFS